jgi:hypothetical protein
MPAPPKPPLPVEQSSGAATTIITVLLLLGVFVGLVLVSLGSILGPLLLLFLALPAIALFHYLVWGWWLGRLIEQAEHEQQE